MENTGSGMNISYHIFESVVTIFRVKYTVLKIFVADPPAPFSVPNPDPDYPIRSMVPDPGGQK
jgi:hypothetical protein